MQCASARNCIYLHTYRYKQNAKLDIDYDCLQTSQLLRFHLIMGLENRCGKSLADDEMSPIFPQNVRLSDEGVRSYVDY